MLNPDDFEVIGDQLIRLDKISSVKIVKLSNKYELRLEGIIEKLTSVITYTDYNKLVNDVINSGMFPNKEAVDDFIRTTTNVRNELNKGKRHG